MHLSLVSCLPALSFFGVFDCRVSSVPNSPLRIPSRVWYLIWAVVGCHQNALRLRQTAVYPPFNLGCATRNVCPRLIGDLFPGSFEVPPGPTRPRYVSLHPLKNGLLFEIPKKLNDFECCFSENYVLFYFISFLNHQTSKNWIPDRFYWPVLRFLKPYHISFQRPAQNICFLQTGARSKWSLVKFRHESWPCLCSK